MARAVKSWLIALPDNRFLGNQVERAPFAGSPPKRNLIIGSKYYGADRAPTARLSWVPSGIDSEEK